MTTAIVHAFKPTRSRVLTVVAILAILFGCYGLLSAQQARSANPNAALAKQVFTGVKVSGATATLVHPSHVTSVSRYRRGIYPVAFDRHMDNCSLSVAPDLHGGSSGRPIFQLINGGQFPFGDVSQDLVLEFDSATHSAVDGDFDIIAICPAT